MPSILAWLGFDPADEPRAHTPLRDLVDALDRLEPERARYLARFAYLLGRIAHADRFVSAEESEAMERLVREHGGIGVEQAMLVVSLAKSSNLMFGGTADYEVAREFSQTASYEQKLTLARCLFAVASADDAVSMAEETEIHRIMTVLRILPADLTALRVEHTRFLPGLGAPRPPS